MGSYTALEKAVKQRRMETHQYWQEYKGYKLEAEMLNRVYTRNPLQVLPFEQWLRATKGDAACQTL